MAMHCILVCFEWLGCGLRRRGGGFAHSPDAYLLGEAFQDPGYSYNINQSTEPKAGKCYDFDVGR